MSAYKYYLDDDEREFRRINERSGVVVQTPSTTDHVEVYRGANIRIAQDVIKEVRKRFNLDAVLEARRKIDYELDGDSH